MNSLLRFWQKKLNLTDWTIRIVTDCLYLNENAGETEWVEAIKSAVIRILSKEAYGNRIKKYDFEVILVHELLHLKFSLLDESGNTIQDRLLHQTIDELAYILVKLKRGGEGNNG